MADARRPLRLSADASGIAKASELIANGGLVALPTETVYGLAARADSAGAVAKIYSAKGRPDFNPLIVHVPSADAARKLAHFGDRAERLAEAFWPGPLTIVLPLREDSKLARAVTAGLSTIALRSPRHPAMRAVLEACALPLAAPSANSSGMVSPTRADHVAADLGDKLHAILDGGQCEAGLESTIVALRKGEGWQILRPGPIGEEALAEVLKTAPLNAASTAIEAPGQLARHYAPGKPVRIGAQEAEDGEFLIGFGAGECDFNLSKDGDLAEAASRLYEALHAGAGSNKFRIAVAPIPHEGLGVAINDRLRRAAS